MSAPEAFEAQFAALRERFLGRLAEEAKLITEAFHVLQDSHQDAQALACLRHYAHRIAGSAGMFRFEALGERALAAENDIEGGGDAVSGSAALLQEIETVLQQEAA